jgi:hypothetical protein
MVVPWRAIGAAALVLLGAGSAWQFQNWRYGGSWRSRPGCTQKP